MSSATMQTMPAEMLPQDDNSTDHRWLRIKDAVCAWRAKAPPEGDDVLFIEEDEYEDYKDAIEVLLYNENFEFISSRPSSELGRLRFFRNEDALSQLPPAVYCIVKALFFEFARRDLAKFVPNYGLDFREGGHIYELCSRGVFLPSHPKLDPDQNGHYWILDVSLCIDTRPIVIFDVQTSHTKKLHSRVPVWFLLKSIAVVICVDIHEIGGIPPIPLTSMKNGPMLSMSEFEASATRAADGHLEWSVENVTTRWAGDFNVLVTVYHRDFGDFDQTGVERIRTSEQLDLATEDGIIKFDAILAEQSKRLRERLNLNPLFSLSVDKRGLKSMISGLHMQAAYERYSVWARRSGVGIVPLPPVHDSLYVPVRNVRIA